jgi:replicative DNA helicase
MIDEQDKQTLKSSLAIYLQAIGTKTTNGKYNCPICGSGTGKHHTSAFSIAPDGQSWKCFSCNAGGDVFELAARVNNLDPKGDFNKVANIVADAVGYNLQNTASDARKDTATATKTKTGITFQQKSKTLHRANLKALHKARQILASW